MALSAGTHLGPYEILSALGVGGMGEVYRARDATLNRDVAIKVLLPAVANDPERLLRFRREAQVLASLNHPNIAHIYGLEGQEGLDRREGREGQEGKTGPFLVMELVEGPTLAEMLSQGLGLKAQGSSPSSGLPLEDALPIARQIAVALEAAHEQGIVHRDLKPANVKVRTDGTVKVLDFGLAKALEPPGSSPNASLSPTITTPAMTQAGMVLGTAAYMAPEQAKGRPADKRSDVWAFGCVFYEMLTGSRAFPGEDVSDTLATVLKSEPDWTALPSNVPAGVRALIYGCLRKDRKERIGDISTALFVLGQPRAVTEAALVGPPPPVWRRAMLVAAGVLVGAAIAAAMLWNVEPSPEAPVTRFVVTLPQEQQLIVNRQSVAFSPDGTRIVYAAEGRLFLRPMADLEARAIPGTEEAINPVFSPDGQSLVFWADSALKRISIGGGTATTISQVGAAPSSIAWSDDSILFVQAGTIKRVSLKGGTPEVLLDLSNSEDQAFGPQLLPDGRTLLFTIHKRPTTAIPAIDAWDAAQIVVQSLETDVRKLLIDGGGDARYVPTGHILYASEGTLFAVPFDVPTLAVTGGAVPVVEGVRRAQFGSNGSALFAVSDTGSLVYAPGPVSTRQQDLVLFDRKGGAEPLGLPPGSYNYPRVSPDGKWIALETTAGKDTAVSIYELSGASALRRLTLEGNNRYPIWADNQRVTFQSDREGDRAVWWQPAEGGKADRLTTPEQGTSHVPESWSPDGELLFSATKDSVWSLWSFSLKDRKAIPFSDVKGSSLPTDAMFSPDGRLVAYQVGEPGVNWAAPGRPNDAPTYAEPFPPTGEKHQLPTRGGRPLWSRDGTELFFVPSGDRFQVVNVRREPNLSFTNPVDVPRMFGVAAPVTPRTFDVMPDGRIVGVGPSGQGQSGSGPPQLHVVLNWFEELKARAPIK